VGGLVDLFGSDSSTSSSTTTLENGVQGNDNITTNIAGTQPGGVNIVSTDHGAISQAEDILNAALVYSNDQIDTAHDIVAQANQVVAQTNQDTLDFSAGAIKYNTQFLAATGNAVLNFANDQTTKTVGAVTSAANAALVFADDQSQRLADSFHDEIAANSAANDAALSALTQGQQATLNTVQSFADQAFTFAGQGVSKTIDAITQSNQQEQDFLLAAIQQGNEASQHAADLIAGNAQAVFDTVTNFSDKTLNELSTEANANLQAVTAAQRSDAANSLDNVIKVAGVAFVGLAIAAIFIARRSA